MSPPINVSPALFAQAAEIYSGGYDEAGPAVTTLANALDDNWGCAGTDDAGHTWTQKYDPAADDAITLADSIVNCLGKLRDLLQATSAGHTNADNGSKINASPADQQTPLLLTPCYAAPRFRGAYGGNSDTPFGWALISRWVQGKVWPNAHSGKLDTIATAWHTAATTFRAVETKIGPARAMVADQQSPEVDQILTQIDLVTKDITIATDQFDALGGACSDYSQAVEDAHHKILGELAKFLAVAGLVEGIGWLAGGIFGGAASTLAVSGRGAMVGARIAVFCTELAGKAALAAVPVAAGAGLVGSGILNTRPLLDANPTTFYADTGGGGGIPENESQLSPAQQRNYNRYVKKLPAKAEQTRVEQLADGNVRFTTKVPSNNIPGSYANYIKVIDSNGNTVSYVKDTYAPNGSVVHSKIKYP